MNLHLHIGGKQPGGFHEIESVFIALSFGDTLYFQPVSEPQKTEISMDWQLKSPPGFHAPELPTEKNIVFAAVSLFRSHTGYDRGLKITIEKRIPPGGGLGGGSSNAASALIALNRLASPDGCGLPDAAIAEMAQSLGSDVPFFLSKTSAAWVSGRGERVQPIPVPESIRSLSFVLVNPGFPSDTAEAYRLLDQRRLGIKEQKTALENETACQDSQAPNSEIIPRSPRVWRFFNDFLPVFPDSSGYRQIISSLLGLGADFAGLSGSGSTCFGVFAERNKAEAAEKSLRKHWHFVINTCMLNGSMVQ